MRRPIVGSLLPLLLLCSPVTSNGQDSSASIVKFPQEIAYKGEPGKPQHVTIFGDSSKHELYVDRIRFPAGTRVMPHWHPDEVRTVLVVSGTF